MEIEEQWKNCGRTLSQLGKATVTSNEAQELLVETLWVQLGGVLGIVEDEDVTVFKRLTADMRRINAAARESGL